MLTKLVNTIAFTAISFSLFAGTPTKGDAKDAAASPTEVKSTAGTNYYWFEVDDQGNLPVNAIARSNTASATDPSGCTTGATPCSLAFDQADTQLNGSGQRILKSGVNEASAAAESSHD